MPHTLTATTARVRFGQLLHRVAENGETVVVERNGKPQAVVLPLAEYERLRELESQAPSWEELLDDALTMIDRDLGGRALPPPEEVIRQMRDERDAELRDLR